MRFAALSLFICILGASGALVRSTREERTAAAPASSKSRCRDLLRELTARAKYPDLFRKRDDAQPSHEVCVEVCPNFPEFGETCTWESGPPPPTEKKKRDEIVMLEPEAAAAFLLAEGAYEHQNGTGLIDYDFRQAGLDRRVHALKRWKVHHWVRSALGNAVMDLGMPIYAQWRRHYANQPEYEFMLSDTHGFLMGELAEIEAALLDTPDWQEFELGEWRITRRFLEVAHDLK